MLTKTYSVTSYGLDLVLVTVEVNISGRGFPGFDIIGLPGKEISESKERISTALRNIGITISGKKILVNLAPADLPKDGSFYDLPIAIGIISLMSNLQIPSDTLMLGELSLDGTIKYSNKAFLACMYAYLHGYKNVIISDVNAINIESREQVSVLGFSHLNEVLEFLQTGIMSVKKLTNSDSIKNSMENNYRGTLDDIIGQDDAKRAILISAAGRHNMHFEGPPGAGKTLLSHTYSGLLPNLDLEDSFNVTKIHAITGTIKQGDNMIKVPPYRSPHHTTSYAGMIGGGNNPIPGEISLAHKGVLFLDEFPEFNRQVIESLRQPLEEDICVITRKKGTFIFPADFTLLAASNPCPCGYHTHHMKKCTCTPQQIQKYKSKISGPILDRIDIKINVKPVDIEDLNSSQRLTSQILNSKFSHTKIKASIIKAREIQNQRFKNDVIKCNSKMKKIHIDKYCKLDLESRQLMTQATKSLVLSARAYFKVIKVARTIADLESSPHISSEHIAEALQYSR